MRDGAAAREQIAFTKPGMSRKVLGLLAALGALALLPLSTGAALADKRVALVIGNGAYQNVAKLPNPRSDATAVADLFKRAGFEWVKIWQDLGNQEFKRVLREFMEAAQDADAAVVYYAGHGIQVRETNYIIPVDAKLATEFDVQDEAIPLDRILTATEPAKWLRMVILDACRENPFADMKVANATRSLGRGLARVEPENNVLVAYAAKSGQLALDGTGENSPFTAALLKHLVVPGLDIRLAFGRIRDEVLKSTGFKQEPFVYGSLGGDAISLVAPLVQPKLELAVQPKPDIPVQPNTEVVSNMKADYELAKEIGTLKAWEAFLNSHNKGFYVDLAREQLAKLVQEDKPAVSIESGGAQKESFVSPEPAILPNPSPASKEREDWALVKDSDDRGKLREFIAKYSGSPLAEQAKNRLDALDRAAREHEAKARVEQEARLRREQKAKEAETTARKGAQSARQSKEQARVAKSDGGKRQAKPAEREKKATARQQEEDRDGRRRQAKWRREERGELARARQPERPRHERAVGGPAASPPAILPAVGILSFGAARPAGRLGILRMGF